MTAGCCGTLLTPVTLEFQYLPVAPFGYERSNGVINTSRVAIVAVIIHVFLMLHLAF